MYTDKKLRKVKRAALQLEKAGKVPPFVIPVDLLLAMLPMVCTATALLGYAPALFTPPQAPFMVGQPQPHSTSRAMPAPRMALIDPLRRRGEQSEDVVDNAFYNVAKNEDKIAVYRARAERINELEDAIEELSDEELVAKTAEFRKRLSAGASEDELLEEVFAVVREAAWRTLELRHYDVQLIGAMALHDGYLAQMGTGEGKTLVATCAVYLNALSGKGAMLVTANDYLARRDAETMGQVYAFLGLSVGLVQADTPTAQRAKAYNSDVTYVTNSEVGFDYLRDHLAMTPAETVLRDELNFCVVGMLPPPHPSPPRVSRTHARPQMSDLVCGFRLPVPQTRATRCLLTKLACR